MPTRKRPAKRDTYHHGDLKAALLLAAREVLAKEGVGALSLREVARRAGVTHAAPYRHFADKAALLAAIAAEGFSALSRGMEERVAEAKKADALEKLLVSGEAYVAFALEHPDHYRVMLGNQVEDWDTHAALKESSEAAMVFLVQRIVAAQEAGQVRPGDPMGYASACWAMTHGLAMGLLDRVFEGGLAVDPKRTRKFVRQALENLVKGLKAG